MLADRLCAVLDQLTDRWEVILVDDGSVDATYARARSRHEADGRFKVVRLSRNLGHQVALSAGLDVALGDAVITPDGDLQHPPKPFLSSSGAGGRERTWSTASWSSATANRVSGPDRPSVLRDVAETHGHRRSVGCWRLWSSRPALTDPDAILDASGRIPTASSQLFAEIVDGWPLVSIAVAAAVLAAVLVRLVWPVAFVGLWALLAFAALVAVYYASTAPLDWLLITSGDRAVYSIPLGLATMAPILVGLAWERLRTQSDQPSPAHGRVRDGRLAGSGSRIDAVTDLLFDLSGRVAVVTGGMGQLGAELSVALAARGVRVAILDLTTEVRVGAAGLRTGLDEGSIRAHACDVTDRDAVEAALALVEVDWGTPHVLVNAAAIDAPPDAPASEVGPFEEVPPDALERVVHVNILGVVVPCQVIGGAMARAGRGSIVNVGSVYGLLSPDQGLYDFRREEGETFFKPVAYSVSKAALLNLTRYLATYWGRSGVRVNTLTPHGIENGQPEAFVEAFAGRSPLGRLMDVSEAVGAVVFLASDASSYVTGANLVLDGGWSAW